MPIKERKPLYETYEKIVKEIIEKHQIQEYLISELDALDRELISQLKMIREKLLTAKKGN